MIHFWQHENTARAQKPIPIRYTFMFSKAGHLLIPTPLNSFLRHFAVNSITQLLRFVKQ